MLREVIEDALQRGERLKKDIVKQVLSSVVLNDLVTNRHFMETVVKVLQTKEVIGRLLKKNIEEALKMMSVPSREQLESYQKRIARLEERIDHFNREMIRDQMRQRLGRKRRRR